MAMTRQTLVLARTGVYRRLMARGKNKASVIAPIGPLRWDPEKVSYISQRVRVRPDGAYRGTKVEKTVGGRQILRVLIQHDANIVSLPPHKVEFYWQEGTVKNGRFTPLKPPPSPPTGPATP